MDAPYAFIADLASQVPEIPPDAIISRTFYNDGQIKAILFGFAAGQELSEHTASKPAMLHFLRGEARLTVGGDPYQVGPGAWVHMRPNLPHSIFAATPVLMLLYMLETPSGA